MCNVYYFDYNLCTDLTFSVTTRILSSIYHAVKYFDSEKDLIIYRNYKITKYPYTAAL